jgi:hypothetical protein
MDLKAQFNINYPLVQVPMIQEVRIKLLDRILIPHHFKKKKLMLNFDKQLERSNRYSIISSKYRSILF